MTSVVQLRVERAFLRAEKAIKRYEMWFGCTPTPAVQQLRYAGNHLVRYVKAVGGGASSDSEESLLAQAVNHCHRAWLDAFDGLVITLLDAVREFQDQGWSLSDICLVYPEYLADCEMIAATVDFFRTNAFEPRASVSVMLKRFRLVKAFLPIYRRLVSASSRLVSARENFQRRREIEDERRSVVNTAVSFSTTVIGATATVIAILSTEVFSVTAKGVFILLLTVAVVGCWYFFWRGRTKEEMAALVRENESLKI